MVTRIKKPLILAAYEDITKIAHLLPVDELKSYFLRDFADAWFCPQINTADGICLKNHDNADMEFEKVFKEELSSSLCIFTSSWDYVRSTT